MTSSVSKKRDEILRLLQQVRSGSAPPSAGSQRRALQHRRDIAQLKHKRSDLEHELAQAGFYELYRRLEDRLDALEAAVQLSSAAPEKGPEPLKLPSGPAAQSTSAQPAAINYTLGGKIQEGILADILQMISSNMMSGQFSVSSDTLLINLYFDEGQICHAEGEGMAGESAFFGAMALEEGQFCFHEGAALPEQRTIESQTQFLILEGLRQIDESRAKGG